MLKEVSNGSPTGGGEKIYIYENYARSFYVSQSSKNNNDCNPARPCRSVQHTYDIARKKSKGQVHVYLHTNEIHEQMVESLNIIMLPSSEGMKETKIIALSQENDRYANISCNILKGGTCINIFGSGKRNQAAIFTLTLFITKLCYFLRK